MSLHSNSRTAPEHSGVFPFLRLVCVLIGVCFVPVLAASHARLSVLRAPPAATAELDDGRYASHCEALEGVVRTYLRAEWQIDGRRCFLLRPQTNWISMEKFVDAELAPHGGVQQRFDWHEPGRDRIALWRIGRITPDYLATAMSDERIDGQPVVAYFALQRSSVDARQVSSRDTVAWGEP